MKGIGWPALVYGIFALSVYAAAQVRTDAKVRAESDYAKLPLSFEPNQGQSDAKVKFLSRGPGYILFLTQREAVLSLRRSSSSLDKGAPPAASPSVLRLRFAGAKASAIVVGKKELPAKTNYLFGNDPRHWHTDVPNYEQAEYQQIYDGVNAIFRGDDHRLEFDFAVAEHADPRKIALNVEGARNIRLDSQGNVLLSLNEDQDVVLGKPCVYQEISGQRHEITGSFILQAHNRIAFAVGSYDHSRPLVIDPTLSYSTFLGGQQVDTVGMAIAVDSAGSAYVTGTVAGTSFDFPTTTGSFKATTTSAGSTSFLSKLSPDGSSLVYSTYFGGSTGNDVAASIAVDGQGNIYITGWTSSSDFPTTSNSYEPQRPLMTGALAASSCSNLTSCPFPGPLPFVSKLNADGSALVYSSYLDGIPLGEIDMGAAIAVDAAGEAYILGRTTAAPINGGAVFPTTPGAFQSTFLPTTPSLDMDFVTKLSADGSSLLFSTFLGGTGGEEQPPGYCRMSAPCPGIAVDSAGNAYVSDMTWSPDFPTTTGAFQTVSKDATHRTVFVTKFASDGTAVYSTFLGGSTQEAPGGIAADSAGNAYVAGWTGSADFPVTPGAAVTSCVTTSNAVCGDIFVTKINPTGTALVYSTFLGTSGATSIAVDSQGSAIIVGGPVDADFPETSGAFYPPCTSVCASDFIQKLSPNGSTLLFSSIWGPNDSFSVGAAVAVDTAGNAYMTGANSNQSGQFKTTPGAFQTAQPDPYPGYSAFISKFTFGVIVPNVVGAPQATAQTDINAAGLTVGTVTQQSSSTVPQGDVISQSPAAGASVTAGTAVNLVISSGAVVTLTSIAVTPANSSIAIGTTLQLTATGNYSDGSTQNLTNSATWSSTNSAIVEITSSGQTTGVAFGSATINATSGSITGSTLVHALYPSAVRFGISPSGPVPDGGSITLTVTVTSSIPAAPAPTGTVSFLVGSAAVGTTTLQQGTASLSIAGLPPGSEAMIASYSGDGNFSGSTSAPETVTVNPPDYGINANPSVMQLAAGQSASTTITVTPLGFSGTITVSCGTLPAYITCAFTPPSGSLTFNSGSTTPQSLTLTISVASSLGALTENRTLVAAAIMPFGLLGLVFVAAGGNRRQLWRRASAAAAGAVILAGMMAGCGGGSGGKGNGVSLPPAGAQTVTISAAGASPSGKISHQLQLTVTITN